MACIGPVTAATAAAIGVRVDLVAEEYTIDGLLEAIKAEVEHQASDIEL